MVILFLAFGGLPLPIVMLGGLTGRMRAPIRLLLNLASHVPLPQGAQIHVYGSSNRYGGLDLVGMIMSSGSNISNGCPSSVHVSSNPSMSFNFQLFSFFQRFFLYIHGLDTASRHCHSGSSWFKDHGSNRARCCCQFFHVHIFPMGTQ